MLLSICRLPQTKPQPFVIYGHLKHTFKSSLIPKRRYTVTEQTPGRSSSTDFLAAVPQDFFNYTSGRWIYNEKQQLAARRIDFSVTALKKAAADALGISESLRMIKLPEGLFNRVFLLSNNDGAEVIARVPTSLAGPPHLTTASEVATLKLMSAHGIPVPKVLSYSCKTDNDVGCEYILMERAKGVPLWSIWGELTLDQKGHVIAQLVNTDLKMMSLKFPGYGSIYLKHDLPDIHSIPISADQNLTEFRLGPSVQRLWWDKERQSMSIDRGPWTQLRDILNANSKREISWIKSYARPRPEEDLFRRSDSQENPSVHINLLERYLKIVPLLEENVAFVQPSILHMDLHPGNIIVESAKRPLITAIIDWQGTEVLPLSLTARFPRIVDYDIGENPVNLDIPPPVSDEDLAATQERNRILLKKFWLAKTTQVNPQLMGAIQCPNQRLISSLWNGSGLTWNRDLFSFRHNLMEFVDNCENCPISFSDEERTLHREELGEYNDMVNTMTQLKEMLDTCSEGLVPLEQYEAAKQINEDLKRQLAVEESCGDEELRRAWERWWPFSDRE